MDSIFDKDYTGMSDSQEVVVSKLEHDESSYLPSTSSFEERQSDYGSDDGSMYEVKMESLDNSYDPLDMKQNYTINDGQESVTAGNYTIAHDDSESLKAKEKDKEDEKKKEVKSKKELEEEEREKMQYVYLLLRTLEVMFGTCNIP